MERQPFDIIAELDAQVTEFRDKLRIGIAELHQALIRTYMADSYKRPPDASVTIEAVQRKLEWLLSQVQEYIDSRQTKT